ncbi:alpha/beta fold hydrolase [Streptococcus pneumoniae]|uniref:alpha/beta fold hydrolase n=1 Tax=Streptococcus pneumoniae TaxID=1313 RepID=UPI00387DC5E4
MYEIYCKHFSYRSCKRNIIAPTLIVHGTNDTTAPYQYSVDASQRIPNAKLVTVEGGKTSY